MSANRSLPGMQKQSFPGSQTCYQQAALDWNPAVFFLLPLITGQNTQGFSTAVTRRTDRKLATSNTLCGPRPTELCHEICHALETLLKWSAVLSITSFEFETWNLHINFHVAFDFKLLPQHLPWGPCVPLPPAPETLAAATTAWTRSV